MKNKTNRAITTAVVIGLLAVLVVAAAVNEITTNTGELILSSPDDVISIVPSGDASDYVSFKTVTNIPYIKVVGGTNLVLDSDHASEINLLVGFDPNGRDYTGKIIIYDNDSAGTVEGRFFMSNADDGMKFGASSGERNFNPEVNVSTTSYGLGTADFMWGTAFIKTVSYHTLTDLSPKEAETYYAREDKSILDTGLTINNNGTLDISNTNPDIFFTNGTHYFVRTDELAVENSFKVELLKEIITELWKANKKMRADICAVKADSTICSDNTYTGEFKQKYKQEWSYVGG